MDRFDMRSNSQPHLGLHCLLMFFLWEFMNKVYTCKSAGLSDPSIILSHHCLVDPSMVT